MNIWLVMFLGGALTFGMRMSFIYLFGRFEIPAMVKRALRFVPPAVLSALIAPALFMPNNTFDFSLNNYRLMAGVVAILVGWRTKNTLLTILSGMAALLILMWLAKTV
ncbi:MAG: AzlD domain-containing protein [Anaerolineales bacterium]